MIPRYRYAFSAILVLGLVLIAIGAMQWTQEVSGNVIRNWISPSTVVPAKAYKWTWGVGSVPQSEPDSWHFQVIFTANNSAQVSLLWNLNQSILFERNSSKINETFDVSLPRANQAWRWDWLIENPHKTALGVQNFTIIHYPITYPQRQNGTVAIVVGLFVFVAASLAMFYFRNQDKLRK